jgi:hypothetical protein
VVRLLAGGNARVSVQVCGSITLMVASSELSTKTGSSAARGTSRRGSRRVGRHGGARLRLRPPQRLAGLASMSGLLLGFAVGLDLGSGPVLVSLLALVGLGLAGLGAGLAALRPCALSALPSKRPR